MLRDPFPNEEVLTTWHSLALTTKRVVRSNETASSGILLSHISGTSLKRNENWGLFASCVSLTIALACIAGKALGLVAFWTIITLLVGAVGGYISTRGVQLTIFGAGRRIRCLVSGGKDAMDNGRQFADRVERLAELAQRPKRETDAQPDLAAGDSEA
jgi:hypothetical protein